MTDSRSILPNNGRAPKTLTGCLSLAIQVIEGAQVDHADMLNAGLVADAKRMLIDALHANEYEHAEMAMFNGATGYDHERGANHNEVIA